MTPKDEVDERIEEVELILRRGPDMPMCQMLECLDVHLPFLIEQLKQDHAKAKEYRRLDFLLVS